MCAHPARRVMAGLACMTLSSIGLSAQTAEQSQRVHATSCLDTMSVAPSQTRMVYLTASIAQSTDANVGRMADIFAQSVSLRMRDLLRAHGDTIPSGEPDITWRQIASHIPVGVLVHRDGPPEFHALSPHTDSVAVATLLTAIHNALADGEGPFWPQGTQGDSASFGLEFVLSLQGNLRLNHPERVAFPVFSVRFPPEVLPRLTHQTLPEYPSAQRSAGVTATVVMDVQVDTSGHIVPGSFKDVWSPDKPRPTGAALLAYNAFVNSVQRWLPRAVYEPARLGSCTIAEWVRQPMTFTITGMP